MALFSYDSVAVKAVVMVVVVMTVRCFRPRGFAAVVERETSA